jgi:hypothetical protein
MLKLAEVARYRLHVFFRWVFAFRQEAFLYLESPVLYGEDVFLLYCQLCMEDYKTQDLTCVSASLALR